MAVTVAKIVLAERGEHVECVMVMVLRDLGPETEVPGAGVEAPEIAGEVKVPKNEFDGPPDMRDMDPLIEADELTPNTPDTPGIEDIATKLESEMPELTARAP